jgi:hypothetical protein
MAEHSLTNLEDTSLVAFLLLKGYKIKPWRDTQDSDHVSFDIEGEADRIEQDMQKYYSNEQVGIQDYIKCLKEVKSQMYNLKKVKSQQ